MDRTRRSTALPLWSFTPGRTRAQTHFGLAAAVPQSLVFGALFAALLFSAHPAAALESTAYSMEVLVGGVPLQEYDARNSVYIEAIKGREYSVRLTNRTPERVAVALSVDGLNSIDAKTTTAGDASKWILGPFESITLDGWQTSSSTARRFFFTSETKSYGSWLGKTQNLGVISAAFFRERQPVPVSSPYESQPAPRRGALPRNERDSRAEAPRSAGKDAEQEAAGALSGAGSPTGSGGPSAESSSAAAARARSAEEAGEAAGRAAAPEEGRQAGTAPTVRPENAPRQKRTDMRDDNKEGSKQRLSDQLAATGIGRELDHAVQHVEFDGAESPSSVLEVRYEYRKALVRLGVLPRPPLDRDDPLARRERSQGFADSGFAPDPYCRNGR